MKKLQKLAFDNISEKLKALGDFNPYTIQQDILGSINYVYAQNPDSLKEPPGKTINEGLKPEIDKLYDKVNRPVADIKTWFEALRESFE